MAETDEVKVGEALLDYELKLTEIEYSLTSAITEINTAIKNWPDIYEGESKDSMAAYLNIMYSHLQKLIFFYGNLATYVNNVFETVQDKDEVLARFLESHGYEKVEGDD